jgi:hypothetical protein
MGLVSLPWASKLVDRVLRRHKSAGDGGRARAAVGLQHVAVQVDGAFAELFQIKHRAHASGQ